MLLSILKALLKAYDNTIKEINKESIEEKNEDDILRNKIEEKQYLLEKENLSYIYEFDYYGRYKIREILIDYYVKERKIPY